MNRYRFAAAAVALLLCLTGCGPDIGQQRVEALETLQGIDIPRVDKDEFQRQIEIATEAKVIDYTLDEARSRASEYAEETRIKEEERQRKEAEEQERLRAQEEEKQKKQDELQAELDIFNAAAKRMLPGATCAYVTALNADGTVGEVDSGTVEQWKFVPTAWEYEPAVRDSSALYGYHSGRVVFLSASGDRTMKAAFEYIDGRNSFTLTSEVPPKQWSLNKFECRAK